VNFTTNDFQTMIRTRDWKLVHFLDAEDGQLFDLANDPDEVRNLWNDHGSQAKKRELLDALLTWRIRSQYDHAGWEFEFLDSTG
jgi:arylsulfatase A-like enzyme